MIGGKNADIIMTKPKLIIDYNCEVPELLADLADHDFWDFGKEQFDPDAVYVIGRTTMETHQAQIREFIAQGARVVFSNPAEGSETMYGQFYHLGIKDLVDNHQLSVLSGGDIEPGINNYNLDNFALKLSYFDENIEAMSRSPEIFEKTAKPYTFLFLNGRIRTHRKWMLARLRDMGILEGSLYTNLHERNAARGGMRCLTADGRDLMLEAEPIQYLPAEYEVDRYRSRITRPTQERNVKYHLFTCAGHAEWGEAYIKPEPYIDTYFSVVSETVFQTEYVFRTEKIWKPIIMGHPFVAISTPGFYKQLHDLGFRTFPTVFDEQFDSVSDDEQRAEQIAQAIKRTVDGDLPAALAECRAACEHNQQRYLEYSAQLKQQFPEQFTKWIEQTV